MRGPFAARRRVSSDYIGPVAAAVPDGHARYAAASRALVGRLHRSTGGTPGLEAFTEPLVFAALSGPDPTAWLDQLLCGYRGSVAGTSVRTAPDGSVYVPGVGTWSGMAPGRTLVARRIGGSPGIGVYDGDERVDASFEPPAAIGETNAELFPGGHPLLARLYGSAAPRFGGLVDVHREHVERAFAVIAALMPAYNDLICQVTRKVVLHSGERPNSFATPAAYGALFVNTALGEDEVFLVEDLVHQGGHVLFSAAAFDRERWLQVDPDTPLSAAGSDPSERRTLYVALHGLFTEMAIVDVLDRWTTRADLRGEQAHELRGRLAFALRRLAADVATLAAVDGLAVDGQRLVTAVTTRCLEVAGRRPGLRHARLENQGYNFSPRRYAQLNPAPLASNHG
jgi:hypothetical protein